MQHFTVLDDLRKADPEKGFTISVNKPLDWTSFDVVAKIRGRLKYLLGKKKVKVGHGGTLDPLATGLVVLGIGPGTKSLNRWIDSKKEYTGKIRFGAVTASFDGETEEEEITDIDWLTVEAIREHAGKFTGDILQRPPVFSAVKKGGVPLYKMARRGKTTEIEARPVNIELFEIMEFEPPDVSFRVKCSKGTYIRSLAHDLGQSLGTGAYLKALHRNGVGDLRAEDAFIIADLVSALASVKGSKERPY